MSNQDGQCINLWFALNICFWNIYICRRRISCMHDPFILEKTSSSNYKHCYFCILTAIAPNLWFHINKYIFKTISCNNIFSLFKCQKLKKKPHPFWRILLSWCLVEVLNKGRGKFYLQCHNHIIPVVFVYSSFRTIQTMFVSKLYCKLQYTYSLITLAFIFTNFSCVVVSQAVCNEWDNFL